MNTVDRSNGKMHLFAPIDIDESIRKSEEEPEGSKSWYVKGYATTPDLDLQDDIIVPTGIDISHFITHGYINYEHNQSSDFKIGVPTENTVVDDVGLYVEAKLYKNNPHAKAIWKLAEGISKSGVDRKLGFSIEGYAKQRNSDDPRIIEKSYITNVALTTSPANPNATWESFMKSFITGHGVTPDTQVGAGAIRAESFARSLYNLSFAYKSMEDPKEFDRVWKEVGSYLDAMDRQTPETAVMFLQLFKGFSRNEAIEKIDYLINNDIENREE